MAPASPASCRAQLRLQSKCKPRFQFGNHDQLVHMVRLFVGGVPPGTTCEQLEQRFAAFGTVSGSHVVPPKTYEALPDDEGYHRGFGYVELEPHDDAALRKCMSAYNGSKWRGHVLKCQVAKPDHMQRLQQEREEGLASKVGRCRPPRDFNACIMTPNTEQHQRLQHV